MRDRGKTYLIASSQGDATYPVWQVEVDNYAYKGRFAVEGGAIDRVTGTDGLSAWSGPIGPFPEGARAMHGTDEGAGEQNVKLVDWRKGRRARGPEYLGSAGERRVGKAPVSRCDS